jgi:hypothetical protein
MGVPKCEIAIDYEYDRFTHPLPRTVLTVSKRDVLTFEASPSKSRVVIRLYSSKRKTSTGQVRGILCLFRI